MIFQKKRVEKREGKGHNNRMICPLSPPLLLPSSFPLLLFSLPSIPYWSFFHPSVLLREREKEGKITDWFLPYFPQVIKGSRSIVSQQSYYLSNLSSPLSLSSTWFHLRWSLMYLSLYLPSDLSVSFLLSIPRTSIFPSLFQSHLSDGRRFAKEGKGR